MANIWANEFTRTYLDYKEHQTRRTRLCLAWSALKMADAETTNQDMAWYWIDQARKWASESGTALKGFTGRTYPDTHAAKATIIRVLDYLPQEGPSDMERKTKRKLLVIALDILELAEEAATADNPWFYVEHAEHLCEVIEVPIKVALGTELWPSYRTAMNVVNEAIDELSQEGTE